MSLTNISSLSHVCKNVFFFHCVNRPTCPTLNFYYCYFYTFCFIIHTFLYFFLHFCKFPSLKLHKVSSLKMKICRNWEKNVHEIMNEMHKNSNNKSLEFGAPGCEFETFIFIYFIHFYYLYIVVMELNANKVRKLMFHVWCPEEYII